MSMQNQGAGADSTCPFCGSSGDCHHLLLVVDKTFRAAEGGILMEAFNARWSFLEDPDDDFDEREAFDELLNEVDSLSDEMTEHDHEGGPGMSSAYAIYFVKSNSRATEVLARFDERSK
jgi:hypothetical protein